MSFTGGAEEYAYWLYLSVLPPWTKRTSSTTAAACPHLSMQLAKYAYQEIVCAPWVWGVSKGEFTNKCEDGETS